MFATNAERNITKLHISRTYLPLPYSAAVKIQMTFLFTFHIPSCKLTFLCLGKEIVSPVDLPTSRNDKHCLWYKEDTLELYLFL